MPEIASLISELEALRWTGRKGYGSRALVGACIVKSLYTIPTWTRTVRLIAEHAALREAIGGAPSEWACYRFEVKLIKYKPSIDACISRLLESLRTELPDLGAAIAIDASDLPAYANGQRRLTNNGPLRERFSDPDASWGHRSAISTRKGGGFYGYRLHAAVCVETGLPVAWLLKTASEHEALHALPLLDSAFSRGISPRNCAMDKAYDIEAIYDGCEARGVRPLVPVKATTAVKQGKHRPPSCRHGTWTFSGADFKRKRAKWRCPTSECRPSGVWRKASRLHPLVPRETRRWRDLYSGRSAVEREFGRLKHEYGLTPLRTRGLERVALHVDLVMLARLSVALARAREAPVAA